jgi:hypothetical protein
MPASFVRLLYVEETLAVPRRLRDAGHEVEVLDPGVSPAELAAVAIQEDVDVVAVSEPELGAAAVGSLDDEVVVFCITSQPGPS